MAFTNKISSVIKGAISNKLMDIAGNAFASNFADAGQSKKLAAKIADKSPLDIDTANNAHMRADNNPFKYGLLYYPQETQNLGDGHYIIFDIIKSKLDTFGNKTFDNKGKLVQESGTRLGERSIGQGKRLKNLKKQGFVGKDSNNVIRKQTSGMGANETIPSTNYIADSIVMYTPPQVKFEYKAEYENADTKNLQNIQQFIGETGTFEGMGDFLTAGGDLAATFLRQVGESALEVAFPGAAGFFTKLTGKAINPRMELAFKSVPFRTFSFDFEFAPKNQQELETQHKIIQLMKFHMLPEASNQKYLITPSEFQLTYMYRDNANMYIPKISRCAMTDMSVDYAPEGVFATLKADDRGAAPVITKMSLSFTEMEIMTKETIAKGY